jgi:hypothetical protein
MKHKNKFRTITLIILLVLVLIQFVPIDRSVPEYAPADDYLLVEEPAQEVAMLIKEVCYDCHSYQTRYPWYAYYAPVSMWLQKHVKDGRKKLNFSIWGSYTNKRKDHKSEECVELVKEEAMPLNSYTWTHEEARLSEEQKTMLVSWFKSKMEGEE